MMLSKRPMRFFTSPLLVPCCAHAKAGGLLRSRTVSGAIQQGCARVFDPKKDGAARLVRSSAREPEGAWTGPPRSILITRAKNLYDQKTPKGHQNFTLGKYKPSRSVLTNRDCSAVAGRRKRCVWIGAESSGDLLPPSPPAEKATTSIALTEFSRRECIFWTRAAATFGGLLICAKDLFVGAKHGCLPISL